MKDSSIICLGDNCIDRYEVPVRRRFAGGNGVNTAVFAAKTGCRTAYAGAVGNDSEGRAILEKLREKNIDVSLVQVYPSETAWTDVTFVNNERVFGVEFYDTVRMYQINEEVLKGLSAYGIIHNTFMGGTEEKLEMIRDYTGSLLSMDFGERYSEEFLDLCIPHVDLAFFSTDDEGIEQAGRFAQSMLHYGPSHVILTMGKYGAVYAGPGGGFCYEPAEKIEVVDTLGAGDTFIGTFLGEFAQGTDPAVCMKKATRAAAESCMRSGGFEGCEIFLR